jgi:hypothetical protein
LDKTIPQGLKPPFFWGFFGAAESRALIPGLLVEVRGIPGLKIETRGTLFRAELKNVG